MIQDQERSTAGLSAVTLFNLYTDHIMRNVQLDESQAGIKIGRRNINNPKYADQLSSVTQSCPNLCDPMDCNTPGFPVYHQIMELVQKLMSIESLMPSNCLILCRSPSPPALSLSQHHGLFQ